jgi:hypothetical protein
MVCEADFAFAARSRSSCRSGRERWVYQINGGSELVGDHLVGMRPSNVTANAFRAGFVRREVLLFEWRWETCTCGPSQQPAEAGGSLSREGSVRSSPDKAGVRRYCQMAWAR